MAVALRCRYPGGYPGTLGGPVAMAEGVTQEVSEADARYLCETFPGYFDRMARSGHRGASVAGGLLSGPVRAILPAVRSGEFDGDLGQLLNAEQAGKGRATVLQAIEDRARKLAAGEG